MCRYKLVCDGGIAHGTAVYFGALLVYVGALHSSWLREYQWVGNGVVLLLKPILKPLGFEVAWLLSWLIRMKVEFSSIPFVYASISTSKSKFGLVCASQVIALALFLKSILK